ncbi:hypothetical protein K0N88_001213 [Salmonella enterica]|nr:hypothetical protein [Salmonella enterica]
MIIENQLNALVRVERKREKVTKWLEKIADKNRPRIKADLTIEKDRLDRIIKTKIAYIEQEYRKQLIETTRVVEIKDRNYHGKPCNTCGDTLRRKSNNDCVACSRRYSREYRLKAKQVA